MVRTGALAAETSIGRVKEKMRVLLKIEFLEKEVFWMVDQQTVLLALVAVLVLVSAFQAFQLAGLSGRVQAMAMMGGSYASSQSGGQAPQAASGGQQQQVQLPSGLANAPDMVGGC